jgi:hypothetical protein
MWFFDDTRVKYVDTSWLHGTLLRAARRSARDGPATLVRYAARLSLASARGSRGMYIHGGNHGLGVERSAVVCPAAACDVRE